MYALLRKMCGHAKQIFHEWLDIYLKQTMKNIKKQLVPYTNRANIVMTWASIIIFVISPHPQKMGFNAKNRRIYRTEHRWCMSNLTSTLLQVIPMILAAGRHGRNSDASGLGWIWILPNLERTSVTSSVKCGPKQPMHLACWGPVAGPVPF